MGQLQYGWMACSKCFESSHPINKGRSILSLTTGILLHNNFYTEWHGNYLDTPFEDVPWKWYEACSILVGEGLFVKSIGANLQTLKTGSFSKQNMFKFFSLPVDSWEAFCYSGFTKTKET